ncbi:MAG: hypothetical protein JSU03_07130 [Bacteroidetes bacterium]|nr:hypothetical protein [Bacteroidota bacterium]
MKKIILFLFLSGALNSYAQINKPPAYFNKPFKPVPVATVKAILKNASPKVFKEINAELSKMESFFKKGNYMDAYTSHQTALILFQDEYGELGDIWINNILSVTQLNMLGYMFQMQDAKLKLVTDKTDKEMCEVAYSWYNDAYVRAKDKFAADGISQLYKSGCLKQ